MSLFISQSEWVCRKDNIFGNELKLSTVLSLYIENVINNISIFRIGQDTIFPQKENVDT